MKLDNLTRKQNMVSEKVPGKDIHLDLQDGIQVLIELNSTSQTTPACYVMGKLRSSLTMMVDLAS